PPARPARPAAPDRRGGVRRLRRDQHRRGGAELAVARTAPGGRGSSPPDKLNGMPTTPRVAAGMPDDLLELARAAKGFMPDDEGIALFEAGVRAAASGLGPLLEVGAYCGKSSIYLGAAARQGATV